MGPGRYFLPLEEEETIMVKRDVLLFQLLINLLLHFVRGQGERWIALLRKRICLEVDPYPLDQVMLHFISVLLAFCPAW